MWTGGENGGYEDENTDGGESVERSRREGTAAVGLLGFVG